ncbi:MAG: 5'-3' exonuclease H3TH domain-containing protein, partial [Gaiellaceae bacterium]
FIGLKGDTSDNIPGVPGIGAKTAGRLIAQSGSVESVLEHVDELSPARRRSLEEHAQQALDSKVLATMRRDLPLDCDPSQLVLSPPDRSRLKEMFRQYEFRGLLQRVDVIDEALPAAPMRVEGVQVPWREGRIAAPEVEAGIAVEAGRVALDAGDEVVVAAWSSELRVELREAALVAHDAKPLRLDVVDDTLLMAYLIEPGRAAYVLDDLAAEYGVELRPEPEAEEETAALVRHAATTRRLAGPMRQRIAERGLDHLYRTVELPLTGVLAAMEDAGVKVDTYRMGEITARLADRLEELEASAYELADEEFMLGRPSRWRGSSSRSSS